MSTCRPSAASPPRAIPAAIEASSTMRRRAAATTTSASAHPSAVQTKADHSGSKKSGSGAASAMAAAPTSLATECSTPTRTMTKAVRIASAMSVGRRAAARASPTRRAAGHRNADTPMARWSRWPESARRASVGIVGTAAQSSTDHLGRCAADAQVRLRRASSRRAAPRWWAGKDLNLRRLCRQIYSLLPLAARAPTHPPPHAGAGDDRTGRVRQSQRGYCRGMPSFDVVSEVDRQEVRNAVDQAQREIGTRFDFKNTNSSIEQNELVLHPAQRQRGPARPRCVRCSRRSS